MFGDDFDEVVRQFLGDGASHSSANRRNQIIENEEDERMMDFIETDKKVFLVFELPGYRKQDVEVIIDAGIIEILARRKVTESVAEYLANKLDRGIEIKKTMPKTLKKKKFEWTMVNGVLEVAFTK